MNHLLLIIKASLASQLRWAKQHVYAWLFLAPTVLGLTYLSVSRLAESLSTDDFTFLQIEILGAILYLSLIAMGMSRATAELYHLRRPEYYFESLPVAVNTYLHVALMTRFMRNLTLVFVLLLIKRLMRETIAAQTILLLILFAVLIAIAQVFAALNWVHWGHLKEKKFLLISVSLTIISTLAASRIFAFAIKRNEVEFVIIIRDVVINLFLIVVLYLLTRFTHQRWRRLDMEFARRLKATKSFRYFSAQALKQRFSASVASQLARDFQLTFRGFTSAVYVVAAIALLLLAGLFATLTTNLLSPVPAQLSWGDAMQLQQSAAVKITGSLLTTIFSILTPLLVAYEIPLLWLERATGTSGLEVWQSKLTYTRIISLPAPLLAFLIGATTGTLPLFYSPLLFVECLMLWWSISSFIGALAFEMPTRTALSVILMVVVGAGIGIGASLAFLTNALLPFGLIIYGQVMHGLTQRGRARARYFLMFGDD
ncbi:MAG: hypothetical protein AB1757_07900 [Acidobacteriota bacterium]